MGRGLGIGQGSLKWFPEYMLGTNDSQGHTKPKLGQALVHTREGRFVTMSLALTLASFMVR
jgi:hypothetical protein